MTDWRRSGAPLLTCLGSSPNEDDTEQRYHTINKRFQRTGVSCCQDPVSGFEEIIAIWSASVVHCLFAKRHAGFSLPQEVLKCVRDDVKCGNHSKPRPAKDGAREEKRRSWIRCSKRDSSRRTRPHHWKTVSASLFAATSLKHKSFLGSWSPKRHKNSRHQRKCSKFTINKFSNSTCAPSPSCSTTVPKSKSVSQVGVVTAETLTK